MVDMVDRVLHAPMPFTTGGQTVTDRINAARHSLAGSQLGKAVCKATTEEVMGPKKKHLDYLLRCTHEPNISIPQLANFLIERAFLTNWATSFKSLITVHHLMCYGNERFCQYLASSNMNLDMGNYLDKTSMQGYDMSTHVRRYAKYISDKIYTYRLCAFDFCKIKRGKDDGVLRSMPPEKLLKSLPLLQQQIDSLLEFQVTAADLSNGVINCAFILMFRDLIRLFACYNDGIINLLEKYFDMNKKQAREGLDLYKRFLERMDKVGEFLKVAEQVGVDRGEIPDLTRAPNSLLEALEAHLASLEGRKYAGPPSVSNSMEFTQQAINQYSSMMDHTAVKNIDDATRQRYIEEEERQIAMYKKTSTETNPFAPGPSSAQDDPFNTNPFAAVTSQPSRNNDLDDLLFGTSGAAAASNESAGMNPFASFQQPPANQAPFVPTFAPSMTSPPYSTQQSYPGASPFGAPAQQPPPLPQAQNMTAASSAASFSPPMGYRPAQPGGPFASDASFAAAFNAGASSGAMPAFDPFGSQPPPQPPPPGRPGDLDGSLAALANNLTLNTNSLEAANQRSQPVNWAGPQRSPQHSFPPASPTAMPSGAPYNSGALNPFGRSGTTPTHPVPPTAGTNPFNAL